MTSSLTECHHCELEEFVASIHRQYRLDHDRAEYYTQDLLNIKALRLHYVQQYSLDNSWIVVKLL